MAEKKAAKVTKASVIAAELLKGGETINEIADRAGAVLGMAAPQKLRAQVKGILNHVKKGVVKKWSQYEIVEGAEIKIKLID